MANIYTSGTYLEQNPDWHEKDAPWKAKQILKMLERNKLSPASMVEVGCGTGLILQELQTHLPGVQFSGYDISPQAIEKAKSRENAQLTFHHEDILKTKVSCDVMMFIDVIEHLEDPYTFLRKTKSMSPYKLLHIPLDLSAQSILRIHTILDRRATVGHINYYTKELALALLKDLDFTIVDWFYTGAMIDLPARTMKNRLAKLPRKLLFSMNQDLCARLLGGFSLMVLVEDNT